MHHPPRSRRLFGSGGSLPASGAGSRSPGGPRRLVAAVAAVVSVAGLALVAPAASAAAVPTSSAAVAAAAQHAAAAKPAGHKAARAAGDAGKSAPESGTGSSDVRAVCGGQRRGYAQCMSLLRTNVTAHKGLFPEGTSPAGYGPSDLQSAYDLPSATAGSGETVAVVDAGDDPTAEADLGTYRSQYGLPACTTADGCFEKVNQQGQQGSYPPEDCSSASDCWPIEESLDLDMVSATCPDCHILLVEADSASDPDLDAAEDEAVALGAKYVSNSWASCESSGETSGDQYFDHPGVVITAAGGDSGYDNYLQGCTSPNYPAASPYVTAVGGTTLTRDASTARGWAETAWSPDPSATGSGCSLDEPKPSWQTDPGCANRMTNDVSAVADPQTGLAVYDTSGEGGWLEVGGTSAATPIIASVYALAGSPQAGTNPASYPYLNATGLNDVTSGTNYDKSCTPAYFCTAGPGYDGPTGLGTPDGVTAFKAITYGTLSGTITGQSTGNPVAGATVTAGAFSGTTNSSGQYSFTAAVGSYTVAVKAFGYVQQSASGVQVTAGQSVTQNFALATAANVTLSGTVTDGSGHGWPLSAKVTVAGDPGGTTYASPQTGQYSINVPGQTSYSMQVSAVGAGYAARTVMVKVGKSNAVKNVTLAVPAGTCAALGYQGTQYEQFTGWTGSTPQDGWTVTSNNNGGGTWLFGDATAEGQPPGGDSDFAIADSNGQTPPMNTSLVSPVINMSGVSAPVIGFDTWYLPYQTGQSATVGLSLDGGKSWKTVWRQTIETVQGQVVIPVHRAAGQSDVQVRFTYNTGKTSNDWWWSLDNVLIGGCAPVPGGLVAGVVTDANTGQPVNGAAVTAAGGAPATTGPAAGAAIPGGFYELFSPHAGATTITASDADYQSTTVPVTVTADTVTSENLSLAAGQLTTSPASISADEMLGYPITRTVKLTNNGGTPLHVTLGAQAGAYTPAVAPAGKQATEAPRPAWTSIAPYPFAVIGNTVGYDDQSGTVYSVGGGRSGRQATALGYAYTPSTSAWTTIAPAPQALWGAAGAFINGTMYLGGGFTSPVGSAGSASLSPASAGMYAYNPASGRWSQLASLPQASGGAAEAVLSGQLYIIGGCGSAALGGASAGSACTTPSSAVDKYDPGTGTWTQLASYPQAVGLLACAGIDGEIVCAGGNDGDYGVSATYIYDPYSNTWRRGADIPSGKGSGLWGMAYAGANGQLQIADGDSNNGASGWPTDEAYQYNPVTNAWTALPATKQADDRVGSSCGFYMIGGEINGSAGQVLPGYNQCNGAGDTSWLSEKASSTDIAPGQSATITVRLNSAKVSQPGTYTATLWAATNTPYPVTMIPVSLQVNPPEGWQQVTGTVTGHASPLTSATVAFSSPGTAGAAAQAVRTNGDGQYAWWVPSGPVQVSAAQDGYQPHAKVITVTAGKPATVNFTLKPDSVTSPGHAAATHSTTTTTAGKRASGTALARKLAAAQKRVNATARVCPVPKPGYAACLSLIRTGLARHKGLYPADTAPPGYSPSDLQSAYNLPATGAGQGATVAVVDAGDDPAAEADLATYRQQFGLPACTTADGCFAKVNQQGQQGSYPPNLGWGEEESLDLDMVSAICPNCHIILVEASKATILDLGRAVDEAVKLGAKYVSNSYGSAGEAPAETQFNKYYDHPGVVITAASGDYGYNDEGEGVDSPSFPAVSPDVTAVGGTTLTPDASASRGWTETVWQSQTYNGQTDIGTGSGCSLYEPKPTWQRDTGCKNRTVNDVAAVADPATGVAVYDSTAGGWTEMGGTSAASPIIASTYALAGTPAKGTNPASYPYLHAGGLNDVTSGTNGPCAPAPAYLCTAEQGYDGPTGLGTPDGVTAFKPVRYGTLTGTVTSAVTGQPVTGALVAAAGLTATTSSTGDYTLTVPAGSHSVTASFYGDAGATETVHIAAGQTVTQGFTLTSAGRVTLTGTVSDGAGHGWPLAAKITISGVGGAPARAYYTSPYTGSYRVRLPGQNTYTLTVTPDYPGYDVTTSTVIVGAGSTQHDITVPVAKLACQQAPGYEFSTSGGVFENFTGWSETTALDGWSNLDNNSASAWLFNPQNSPFTNETGGSDGWAIASPFLHSGYPAQDTSLVSPVFSLAGVTSPQITFDTGYGVYLQGSMQADVDLSLDGGATWQTVWQQQQTEPALNGQVPVTLSIPQAAGQSDVQVRFHFTGTLGALWELANIQVGTPSCAPVHGGLVAGVVSDANTGQPVNGVTISSPAKAVGSGASAMTGDPALPGGFYWLFSGHTGATRFTAADPPYARAKATVPVSADAVTQQDWSLQTGQLTTDAHSLTATETLGNSRTVKITFRNGGAVPAHVRVGAQAGGFTPLAQESPSASSWTGIASYPAEITNNAVATDPLTGQVFSVGGQVGGNGSPGQAIGGCPTYGLTDAAYVYDPLSTAWTSIAPLPQPLESPSAAFENGTLYVAGGFNCDEDPSTAVYAYTPGARTWTQAASLPAAVAAPGIAVLDGQLYVVGGCTSWSCSSAVNSRAVYRYDPISNQWAKLASYPVYGGVSFLSCAGIGGEVACAGGLGFDYGGLRSNVLDTTYLYNPDSNTWTQGAAMPYPAYQMASSGANGQLQVAGGINQDTTTGGNAQPTSQVSQYDPATNTWSSLPSLPAPEWGGGGACGMYVVGGMSGSGGLSSAEVLSGYSQCDGAGDTGWLQVPRGFTLRPGQSLTVAVKLDAGQVDQPGTYTADLYAATNTPYPNTVIPVILTVKPPAGWGLLSGAVTSSGGKPIAGATVQIGTTCTSRDYCGKQSYTFTTTADGSWQWWLPAADNGLLVIIAKDGYIQQVTHTRVHPREPTTLTSHLPGYQPPMR